MILQAPGEILSDYGVSSSELSIALVDDIAIRELNRKYLDHDWETDVISFVLDEQEESGIRKLVGQLIVSTDTAQRVAQEVGSSFESELMLYVIHGTLHLCGLDDHEADDIAEMRSEEAKYLNQFGYPSVARPRDEV